MLTSQAFVVPVEACVLVLTRVYFWSTWMLLLSWLNSKLPRLDSFRLLRLPCLGKKPSLILALPVQIPELLNVAVGRSTPVSGDVWFWN